MRKLLTALFILISTAAWAGSVNVVVGQPTAAAGTTSNFYSTTADGYVRASSVTNWATCRGLATGFAAVTNDVSTNYQPESLYYSPTPTWYCSRLFLYPDLTALAGKTIDSVVFHFKTGTANAAGGSLSIQKGTQADTLTTADFDSLTGNEYGHVAYADNSDLSITFDAQGIADFQAVVGGVAKVCIREYTYDYGGTNLTTGGYQQFFYFQDNTTEGNRPYWTITYH